MRAIARALEGEPQALHIPWPKLNDVVNLEPGFFVLGLAAPGVGKSVFALNWALRLGPGNACLFVSTDTDLRTQAMRCYTCLNSEDETLTLDSASAGAAREYLEKQRIPVRWVDALEGVMDLAKIIEAEQEFLGESPKLVVVDVVDDLVTKEEHGAYKEAFKVLHRMARKYKTVIFGLHHIRRGPAAAGNTPVSMDDGTFTGEQTAEVVLGMWRTVFSERNAMGMDVERDRFAVAVLKNRTGRVTGPITLTPRFEVARIEE